MQLWTDRNHEELHSSGVVFGVVVVWMFDLQPAGGTSLPAAARPRRPRSLRTVWGFVDERPVEVPRWTALPTSP